ncbi:IS110 family transposase [Devosia sp. BSSL-BM10]|uniref:IS110 family transposase n=1 Tax=Devosia litorisediminis TaxID=2829817 RepID=A0A942E9X2_9HYPH|nr:IS110 family transposase [Devosia litorisediminis]MBS3848549.1 IS110 family transposase [Devosia litorisediminis]
MIRNAPKEAAVFGVDLGKNLFHVVGLDARGGVIQRAKFRRDTVLAFFQRAAPTLVGMEACPGSQWFARKLQAFGHEVRIVPAQFVKPFVKSQKNDTIDAEAIPEAVTRPTMRFTQVRTVEQIDVQALHRMRDQLVSSRTRLVNQARAFCLEYGIAMRQGIGTFRVDLPRILADDSNDLSQAMRQMLAEVLDDIGHVDHRISSVTRQIEALADREDRARRLMTIPGIGPMAATALLAAVGDGRQFRRARELAAWLGLTPREHSTGGKTTLLGISKRGNRYVRKLLVHGARSCITHMNRTKDRIGDWLDALESRMHVNKVTVALAAKMARMAWAIIVRPGAIYDRRDPAVA